jgi:aspartate--ammonia ligase
MKHIPKEYKTKLGYLETHKAIKLAKDTFEKKLAEKLSLHRVSAPRFIRTDKGLQDDLAGTQIPVSFDIKHTKETVEVVHSLAKWKRHTLGKHKFKHGTGIYTDMDAIRKDEELSPIHSIYVDQWDWERVIEKKERHREFLKDTVKKIYEALLETEEIVSTEFPKLEKRLPKDIKFIHTEELEEKYPKLTPKEREYEAAKEHKALFLIGIGHALKCGEPHDLRAADYDDWHLCGDIIVWDDTRKKEIELSSMGIRVDKDALIKQLELVGLGERKELEFHKGILEETTPLTIGGGIGQSRLCMLLLHKAHIGEVHSSVWPKEVEREFEEKGVVML